MSDTSQPSGTLSRAAPVAAVASVATCATLSINGAGTGYKLDATVAGLTENTSRPVNITP
jgi:hypothetical protein